MKAALLTIGDEILLGQITDTNSAYMADALARIGIGTETILSIADRPSAIRQALDRLMPEHGLILITGGLGPTKDDLTKKVLADYFDDALVFHDQTYRQIRSLLDSRGIAMNPLNRDQAMLPSKARILPNRKGTAAGMWFEKDGKIVVSLPGVPFEMEHLMQCQVLPLLKERFPELSVAYRMYLVYNIAESILAEKLEAFEKQLPCGIGLAYLPSPGLIKLRLTADRNGLDQLDTQFDLLGRQLKEYGLCFFSAQEREGRIEEHIGKLLREKAASLSTAESCTGGYLAHLITSVPGSSDYYKGSIISYSNRVKEELLGVSPDILSRYGAVSGPTVKAMAEAVKRICRTDYALATSGIAGPGGGTEEKPVGTVWIALATPAGCQARRFRFSFSRERNIARSAVQALVWLSEELEEKNEDGITNPEKP